MGESGTVICWGLRAGKLGTFGHIQDRVSWVRFMYPVVVCIHFGFTLCCGCVVDGSYAMTYDVLQHVCIISNCTQV